MRFTCILSLEITSLKSSVSIQLHLLVLVTLHWNFCPEDPQKIPRATSTWTNFTNPLLRKCSLSEMSKRKSVRKGRKAGVACTVWQRMSTYTFPSHRFAVQYWSLSRHVYTVGCLLQEACKEEMKVWPIECIMGNNLFLASSYGTCCNHLAMKN